MRKPEGKTKTRNGKRPDPIKLDSFSVDNVRMWDDTSVTADIRLNNVYIYGVRVVEGKDGDFLSLPSRKAKDGKYYSICYFPFDDSDQKAILAEIERKLNDE